MTDADIYRVRDDEIKADINGREICFAYNPDTRYVLVPSSVYGAEPELMDALRDSEHIDGIFNHPSIKEA